VSGGRSPDTTKGPVTGFVDVGLTSVAEPQNPCIPLAILRGRPVPIIGNWTRTINSAYGYAVGEQHIQLGFCRHTSIPMAERVEPGGIVGSFLKRHRRRCIRWRCVHGLLRVGRNTVPPGILTPTFGSAGVLVVIDALPFAHRILEKSGYLVK